jgi:hypothetical protein
MKHLGNLICKYALTTHEIAKTGIVQLAIPKPVGKKRLGGVAFLASCR